MGRRSDARTKFLICWAVLKSNTPHAATRSGGSALLRAAASSSARSVPALITLNYSLGFFETGDCD